PKLVPAEPHADHHGHDDHGDAHGHEHHEHNHEPMIMIAPLVILAIGAILAGYLNFPSEKLGHFLGQSPSFVSAYEIARDEYDLRRPEHPVNPVMFGLEDTRPEEIQ